MLAAHLAAMHIAFFSTKAFERSRVLQVTPPKQQTGRDAIATGDGGNRFSGRLCFLQQPLLLLGREATAAAGTRAVNCDDLWIFGIGHRLDLVLSQPDRFSKGLRQQASPVILETKRVSPTQSLFGK